MSKSKIVLLFFFTLFPLLSKAQTENLKDYCILKGDAYIVNSDINLNGKTVYVKNGARLIFKNGSITNGTMVLSDNKLQGNIRLYCGVTGTISNKKGQVSWFGREGDDITAGLQLLTNSCKTVLIDEGTWVVSSGIVIRCNQIIRGISKEKSIIKVDENAIVKSLGRLCVFSTTPFTLPTITTENLRNLPDDSYQYKTFRNITISNITFDLNRHPSILVDHKKVGIVSLIAVRYENCENCKITDCVFKDYQEFDATGEDEVSKRRRSVAYAAVFITDCSQCEVKNCYSQNCTFLFVVNSNKVLVEGNKGVNSFGTWIETLGGNGHKILNNHFENQWWKVSTIGVNSVNCEVAFNSVRNDTKNEISCLTLGHDSRQARFKYGMTAIADYAYVHDNSFETTAERGILVQSASNVRIVRNDVICEPMESTIDKAGIVFIGDVTNFKNAVIKQNEVHLKSGNGIGIIGLEMQTARIERNIVDGMVNTGIWIKDKSYNITIDNNRLVNAGNALKVDWTDKVTIINNDIRGGVLNIRCGELCFKGNIWSEISSPCNLKSIDDTVTLMVKNNRFVRKTGEIISSPFSYSIKPFDKVSGNKVENGFAGIGLE